jgi:cytochrome P450
MQENLHKATVQLRDTQPFTDFRRVTDQKLFIMTSPVLLGQLSLFTWFLWLLALQFRRHVKRYRDGRQNACRPTPYLAPRDFLGLKELREASHAFQSRKLLDRTCSQYLRYGTTFTSRTLTQTTIHTIEPDNIKTVLSSKFRDYGIGWRRKNAFRPLLGHSLFQLDGDPWVTSRTLLHGIFRSTRGEELSLVEYELQYLLEKISSATTVCQQVDLAPHFFRLSANVAASYIHGASDHGLEKEQEHLLNAMEASGGGCERRWQLGVLNPLFPQRTFYRNVDTVQRYFQKHVDNFLNRTVSTIPRQPRSFLAALFKHTKSADVLRNEACMLFVAATDTVGCTLTNMFFMIGTDPQVWEKLRQEVQYLAGRAPDMAQLKRLKFHSQCVKECKL